jgi:hypothetical protein
LGNYSLPPVVVDGWRGSIKVESTSSPPQPLAVVVNNLKQDAGVTTGGYSYNGSAYAGRVVVLPYSARNVGGVSTGYTLRNVHTSAVTVTVRYYDANGVLRYTKPAFTLCGACITGFHQDFGDDASNLPNGWQGTIVLEATGPILVILRQDKSSADRVSGYNGIVLTR